MRPNAFHELNASKPKEFSKIISKNNGGITHGSNGI